MAGVLSSSGKPVSAKQNLSPPPSRGLLVSCLVLGFILFFVPFHARADSLEDAAHELAMKVCAAPHKQPVSVQWQESPETSGFLTDSRKKSFLDQISACGMAPTENADAPVLRVAVQATATSVLLIADSAEPEAGRQIRMVELPRAALFSTAASASASHISSEFLWQQEKPIQSAMEWIDQSTQERFLFLLSDELLIRMRLENGSWKLANSTELPAAHKRSRSGDGGVLVASPGKPPQILINRKICGFNPSGQIPFTCGPINPIGRTLQIASKCEEAPRYLATGNGDYTQPDRIILRGPVADQAAPPTNEGNTSSVELPGPVLNITIAENSRAAFAVVMNLSTGNYEVYQITAVCSD